ncbi:MAG TPA: L-arabinose isomerase, partial [Candidatus Dormibacteraeota bacterium]|nr:L-arabinose isomerase [Candidatus Dormibacteraeota bacterium]
MINLKHFEVWFITGSQHLYGPAALKQVAEHAREVVKELDVARDIPVKILFKPVVKTPA